MAFFPQEPPSDPARLGAYILDELRRLSSSLSAPNELLRLAVTNVAPPKPREGDVRLADGTNWDPGSGAGVYYFSGSAWVKL